MQIPLILLRKPVGDGYVISTTNVSASAATASAPSTSLPSLVPAYQTELAAGMDLLAALSEPHVIAPGKRSLIPTGIAFALPPGFEAQVRPRSGLALKHGVTVVNSPGTLDADYRGEVCVVLINHGESAFTVTPGMRIAQVVVAPVTQVAWNLTTELEGSKRGTAGYGSTG
jgi:dUTP pyrophosphatase